MLNLGMSVFEIESNRLSCFITNEHYEHYSLYNS